MADKKKLSEEEEKKQKFIDQQNRMFSAVNRSVTSEMRMLGKKSSYSTLSSFTPEQVTRFLKNPIGYEKELRQLSNYLYNVSGYYKSIVRYFALLPTYAYTIDPVSFPDKIEKEKGLKAFKKAAALVDKMNLRHEMISAMKIAFKEDVFYGYEVEDRDTFYILHLDADYCKISSKGETYNFAFDFSFFDIRQGIIDSYPPEFREKYNQYLADRSQRYIELNPDKTVCFKVNEELEYPLIPLNSIFEAVFDLDEYRKIKKQKTKMDNFLLLTQKIPQGSDDELDNFTINLDLAGQFHDALSNSVPDGISVALSPMEISATRMEKTRSDQDTIQQAQRDIFTDAGVPQQIFNAEKNSAAGINKSIITAEQLSFSMLRQIERWVNKKMAKLTGQYKFQFKLLDQTVFNRAEVQEAFHKAATSALPVKSDYAASLGLTPLETYNKSLLENQILGLNEIFVPLQTSHTQGKEGEGGAPSKGSGVSDSTEAWRETDDAQGEK